MVHTREKFTRREGGDPRSDAGAPQSEVDADLAPDRDPLRAGHARRAENNNRGASA